MALCRNSKCNVRFSNEHGNRKYCSQECRTKAINHSRSLGIAGSIGTCQHCNSTFTRMKGQYQKWCKKCKATVKTREAVIKDCENKRKKTVLRRLANPRHCLACGTNITLRRNAKYCSQACRWRIRKYEQYAEREGTIFCRGCGKPKHVSRSAFCSTGCRDRYSLLRRGVIDPVLPSRPDKCENPYCDSSDLALDHDHSNGRFRGWICRQCNFALGNVQDNPDKLKWLADYLTL
jgi:predicted nucleic acid-binding Zn ribbon protein